MKLIIDIPDEYLEQIKNNTEGSTAESEAVNAIRDGILYEERPQGKWENDDFTVGYTCSVCGSYRVSARVDNFKFCPDCGAKMGN